MVVELLEKLSPEAKERLFRVLQNMEHETQSAQNKLRRFGMR